MIQDYIAYWGEKTLTRYPSAALVDAEIPEASKVFLEQVGMPPRQSVWSGKVTWDPSLPRHEDGRHILAWQRKIPLLLNRDGAVVRGRIPPHPRGGLLGVNERWINASPEQFAQFITAFSRFYRSAEHRAVVHLIGEDREANAPFKQAIDAFEACLTTIDPTAEGGVWSDVFVDVATGLTD